MPDMELMRELGAFPIIQIAVALIIVLGGGLAIVKGNRDRDGINGKRGNNLASNNSSPPWSLYVHDAMAALTGLNEHSREANRTLVRMEGLLRDITEAQRNQTEIITKEQREQRELQTQYIAKELREQTQLLEDIRNNQIVRGDVSQTPVRRK